MTELKYEVKKVINVSDWSDFVSAIYGREYNFQQQDGCQPRGTFHFTIPCQFEAEEFDYEEATVEEIVNSPDRGVSFTSWLARDPTLPLAANGRYKPDNFDLRLWWSRNFYPNVYCVANDLHARGLLPAGNYVIDINW